MGYGGIGGYGGDGITEAVRLAVEASGQGDVQQLIDLFSKLKATQDEIDDAYQKATAAAGKAAQAMKDQAKAGYELIDSYDLVEEAIGKARTAAEREAAAKQWMDRQTKALNDTLEELAEHERTAEKATLDLAAAQGKAATASQQAADKGGGYGAMKWLLLSNALQDVQYGFSAVVNNLPGIVQSFGGSAGLAGAVQIAAVALQVAIGKADAIRELLGKPLPANFKESIEGLTKEVERLSKIEVKTRVDMIDLDVAKQKLDDLKAAREAYDNLGKERPKAMIESGNRFKAAVVEYGGGTDFDTSRDRIQQALIAATPQEETEDIKKARAAKAVAQEKFDRNTNPEQILYRRKQLDDAEQAYEKALTDAKTAHEQPIKDMIGRAVLGHDADIREILRTLQANRDKTQALGVQEGLFPALGSATRREVDADTDAKRTKILDQARHKELDKAIDQSADEHNEGVRKAVASYRAGIEERAVKQVFDAMRAGATPEQAGAGVRQMVRDHLKSKEVDEWFRGDATAQIVEGVVTKAQNLADIGGKPKLDADHDRKVAEQVARVMPGFQEAVLRAMQRHMAAGEDSERFVPDLARQLEGRMASRNVPADMRREVAEKIAKTLGERSINNESRDAKAMAAPFMPEAEAFIKENWLRHEQMTASGGMVARNRKESERFTNMGVPHALSGPAMMEELTRRIAERLRAGGRDVRLADDIAQEAAARVDTAYGNAMATAPTVEAGVNTFMGQGQGQGQSVGGQRRVEGAHARGHQRPHGKAAQPDGQPRGFQSVAPETPAPLDAMQETFGVVQETQQHLGNALGRVASLEQQVNILKQNNARLRGAAQMHGRQIQRAEMQGPSMLPPR